jgi:hypothetical protein
MEDNEIIATFIPHPLIGILDDGDPTPPFEINDRNCPPHHRDDDRRNGQIMLRDHKSKGMIHERIRNLAVLDYHCIRDRRARIK